MKTEFRIQPTTSGYHLLKCEDGGEWRALCPPMERILKSLPHSAEDVFETIREEQGRVGFDSVQMSISPPRVSEELDAVISRLMQPL